MKQIILLKPGDYVALRPDMIYVLPNGRQYAVCSDCNKLVHMNKWLFGDLHQCNLAPDQEPNAQRS